MARANGVITVTKDGNSLQFTVKDAGTLTLDISALSAEVLERAAIHGLTQRISDAAAIPCNPKTGKPATPEEKYANMAKLVEHYNSGTVEWARKREAGEGGTREDGGLTLRAIAAVSGFTIDEAKAILTALAERKGIEYKKLLASLRTSEKVQAEIAKLRKPVKPAVDVDDLLRELEQ